MPTLDPAYYPLAAPIQRIFRTGAGWDELGWQLNSMGLTEATHERLMGAMLHAIRVTDDVFPKEGTIRRAGSYAYVEVYDDRAYVEEISKFLDRIERGFPGRWKALTAGCKPRSYAILPPADPTGSHITLGANSLPLVGRHVRFDVDALVDYHHDARGYKSSSWDHGFFPCRWFVLRVSGPDLLPYDDDMPHISVAVMAYHK